MNAQPQHPLRPGAIFLCLAACAEATKPKDSATPTVTTQPIPSSTPPTAGKPSDSSTHTETGHTDSLLPTDTGTAPPIDSGTTTTPPISGLRWLDGTYDAFFDATWRMHGTDTHSFLGNGGVAGWASKEGYRMVIGDADHRPPLLYVFDPATLAHGTITSDHALSTLAEDETYDTSFDFVTSVGDFDGDGSDELCVSHYEHIVYEPQLVLIDEPIATGAWMFNEYAWLDSLPTVIYNVGYSETQGVVQVTDDGLADLVIKHATISAIGGTGPMRVFEPGAVPEGTEVDGPTAVSILFDDTDESVPPGSAQAPESGWYLLDDLNGDGLADFVRTLTDDQTFGGDLHFFDSPVPNGTFDHRDANRTWSTTGIDDLLGHVDSGDLNGDGLADLAGSWVIGDTTSVWVTHDAASTEPELLDVVDATVEGVDHNPINTYKGPDLPDLDGDGRPDLMYSYATYPDDPADAWLVVRYDDLSGASLATEWDAGIHWSNWHVQPFTDIDGDGLLDVVIARYFDSVLATSGGSIYAFASSAF